MVEGTRLLRSMDATQIRSLLPRQGDNTGTLFLQQIAKPFDAQLGGQAVISSLLFSVVFGAVVALLFCFLRPYNNVVYAPRAKHADSKHAPPPVSKGFFAWIPPLIRTKEADMVDKVGLDAAVFMRVCRMFRNMMAVLTIIGCGIILPVNILAWKRHPYTQNNSSKRDDGDSATDQKAMQAFSAMTPIFLYGRREFWAYVVVAYLFDFVVMFFLWINYRAVVRLRRAYFDSSEYQRSLHARTLLLTDIPKQLRSDEGIVRITDELKATRDTPRAAIARNVKELPELVEEHEETVRALEGYLAKYLKNPDKLPAKRPVCKVSKKDKTQSKGQKVDAIEYLTSRIQVLETEIKEVRVSVDKRNAMSYGFASYDSIAAAHGAAYLARKSGPQGTIVKLAPRPNGLVWKNLKMTKKERSWQNFINRVWVTALTIVWVVPNVMIAVFLSNLAHLGALWPKFQTNLEAHPQSWALVQGIAAPLLTTLFYYFLPAIFRRLATNSGDISKTEREAHVLRSLYSFFTLNNLIVFSLFSALFGWIATVSGGKKITDTHPFQAIMQALCTVSPYWVSWLLQRNMGAAVDLSQLATLLWGGFSRRFLSPTPRQLIELTAPQPFDYAGYYNYFLFYATVAICFGTIQPIVLPVTALYFWIDSFAKKYLLLYVFITKYESGGQFWRTIYNRVLVMSILGNVVIGLLIVGQGDDWRVYGMMLIALAPLPFIIAGFKWYCARAFDDQIYYYQKGKSIQDLENVAGAEGKKSAKRDKVGVRFGHPVLYKPLITPMVSAKAQHLLKNIYTGRTSLDDNATLAGYSEFYMDSMDAHKPGKHAHSTTTAPFEFVSENEMDFEHYKDRPEFRDEAGGEGQLFGHAQDIIRPGTPSSIMTGITRTGTMESSFTGHVRNTSSKDFVHSRSQSRGSDTTKVGVEGTEYPRGYHQTPSALREHSPAGSHFGHAGVSRQDSREGLFATAAPMGRSTPQPGPTPGGYGPIRNGGLGAETPGSDTETSYDYFRRGRSAERANR